MNPHSFQSTAEQGAWVTQGSEPSHTLGGGREAKTPLAPVLPGQLSFLLCLVAICQNSAGRNSTAGWLFPINRSLVFPHTNPPLPLASGSSFPTGVHLPGSVLFLRFLTDLDFTVRILLYSLIFLLSVFGNALIILVLVLNKRLRTVTNSFLLSLALSDLMLSVFCIPFTVIPNLMQTFIFGKAICKTMAFLQGEFPLARSWGLGGGWV